jgi:aldose 1-epimerase
MMITTRPFGTLSDGTAVTCYRLTHRDMTVDILDYGATVQSVILPDRTGQATDVVLGYPTAQGYEHGTIYLGATVGRHAGRIGKGQFTLNGKQYQLACNCGPNHSHGGLSGYHQRLFQGEIRGQTLVMRLHSPHGDQGYPGNLDLAVEFSLKNGSLSIHYVAESDQDTVVNLTNHSYFDLSGGRDPLGQVLTLDADQYLENDRDTLPTGVLADVAGTPFDFRQPKALGRDIGQDHQQLNFCGGYDHCYCLKTGGQLETFARLYSPETGIAMTAATDLPGVQLYSGNFIQAPEGKRPYSPRDALCLETQFFPNALAQPHFPSPILRAGQRYDHTTVYHFGLE